MLDLVYQSRLPDGYQFKAKSGNEIEYTHLSCGNVLMSENGTKAFPLCECEKEKILDCGCTGSCVCIPSEKYKTPVAQLHKRVMNYVAKRSKHYEFLDCLPGGHCLIRHKVCGEEFTIRGVNQNSITRGCSCGTTLANENRINASLELYEKIEAKPIFGFPDFLLPNRILVQFSCGHFNVIGTNSGKPSFFPRCPDCTQSELQRRSFNAIDERRVLRNRGILIMNRVKDVTQHNKRINIFDTKSRKFYIASFNELRSTNFDLSHFPSRPILEKGQTAKPFTSEEIERYVDERTRLFPKVG